MHIKEGNPEGNNWSRYMKGNSNLRQQVRDYLAPYIGGLKNGDSVQIDNSRKPLHAELDHGESINGYQYLHGSESTVGDFQISGVIRKTEDGDIIIEMTYTWNDKINPNKNYPTDIIKAGIAKIFANPHDYVIRITPST